MFATTYYADPAPVIGVHWDRAEWAWRAQDGNGHSSTHPTWSEAKAALDAMPAQSVTITWGGDDYPPEGKTVDLSTFFPESWGLTKAPPEGVIPDMHHTRRARKKRKGKRK